MSDWPGPRMAAMDASPSGNISTMGNSSPVGWTQLAIRASSATGATWPVASQAIYTPVLVPEPTTVTQMAIQVVTQSGNCDVGIYDEAGNRIISSGTTAVAAAGIQVFNIADTLLDAEVYYFAVAIDNTTASIRRWNPPIQLSRVTGVQIQATAFVLPNPATFAPVTGASNNYVPQVWATTRAGTI